MRYTDNVRLTNKARPKEIARDILDISGIFKGRHRMGSYRERLGQAPLGSEPERILPTAPSNEYLFPKGNNPSLPPSNTVCSKEFMVGDSPAMLEVFYRIRRFALSDAPILISGETGTGKELAAQAVHERSSRRTGPFITVNAAALPATLIASELFGYEKGAFTGATSRKIGLIEKANDGTLFLDEIGDLPLDLQGHFLRFLQERTITRIGGHSQIPVNARVISATHVDLESAVSHGAFRDDLFFA